MSAAAEPPSEGGGAFSDLLRRSREAAGLSQEALADRAGLSPRGLLYLERGTHRPYPDTLRRLADALALTAQEREAWSRAARSSRPAPPASESLPPPPPQPARLVEAAAEWVPAHAMVPFVGRTRELALLERHLGDPPTGEGATTRVGAPVLLLSGEPGIGKSRLLQEAAQRGVAQGLTVLAGGCHRQGSQEPYAPLLDALAQHLHAQAPGPLRAALSGCAWLVRLLPELAQTLESLSPETLPPDQERRLMFAAVARVLANVAGPAGTLLVLDDLQWAGPDALDLLAMLVRSPALAHRARGAWGEGVLRVVGAYRDTEVRPADPLGLLLADLAQAGLARQYAVGPLAAEDAASLLDNLLGGVAAEDQAVAESVLQRGGGIPFFLISYAQARQQGSAEAVPWDLAQALRQRVALLPAAGQEILGAAAIVGRHVPRALLLAMAGQPEEEVLLGLEAACRARLLHEDGDTAYVFAHDVIREVVEAEVGAARRALLHRRVAAALAGAPAGAPAELLAYHYARGGIQDRAVQYLELAGDHAWAQRAHGAAERHYREVVDRLEAMGCAREAVHVREKLGEVLYRAGRYDAAIRVLEPAAEAFHAAGDEESLGRVTTWMGRAHGLRGTPHEGVALITALLEPLDRGDAAPPLARLYLELGRLLFTAGQYNASLAASERAADVARAGGDDHTRVLAERDRANILAKLGRLGDALCLGQKVLPLIETMGDLDRLLVTHRDLAYIHALQGAFAPCQRHIDRALGLAGQMGEPGPIASTLAVRGWFALLRGEWQGARADLDQAVELSRQVDRSWHLAYVLICRARLSLAEGAWAAAAALVQEAIALAERSGDLQALRWASTVMAEIDVLAGRPEAATARLFPLLDRPGLEECDVTQLLPVLAWAYLEQGQVEQAVAPVGQALVRARREEMRLVVVEALRVQTLIALPHEQWTEAARSLEEGLALARSMPYPYAEARLLHVYGRLHSQKGEPQAARERLEAARAIFARLGARTDAGQVEQALGQLSPKPGLIETRLTDAQWAQIEALLPPRPRRRGRPRADDRRTLAAILYVQRTGCAWADLPADLGDEATAHRRWQEWQAAGLWERIAAILQATSPGVKGHERTAGTGACTPPEGGLLPSRARPADF